MRLNPELVRSRCQEISDSLQRLEEIAREPKERFLTERDCRISPAIGGLSPSKRRSVSVITSRLDSFKRCRRSMPSVFACFTRRVSSRQRFPNDCNVWPDFAIFWCICIGRLTITVSTMSSRRIWAICVPSVWPWRAWFKDERCQAGRQLARLQTGPIAFSRADRLGVGFARQQTRLSAWIGPVEQLVRATSLRTHLRTERSSS